MVEMQTITSLFCNLPSRYLSFPRYFMFTHLAIGGEKVCAGEGISYLGNSMRAVPPKYEWFSERGCFSADLILLALGSL